MYKDIRSFCISSDVFIQDAIVKINANGLGIVLVVDENKFLLGTITDGDIRRAVLARFDLKASTSALLKNKEGTKYANPLFAYEGESKQVYVDLLKVHKVSHLPIVNPQKQVVGLVTSDLFSEDVLSSLHAVVMAGGRGMRLMPLTENLPKPMLPIGEKPLLEHIIDKLRSSGIAKVNVTTHHKPEKIKEHFGNGENFGIDLSYVAEDRPLGTAGALGLLEEKQNTTLVMNGDILTDVDFKTMFQFHREHHADLTVAVRSYELEVPYGVIECDGVNVQAVQEKPKICLMVNAGIYILEPHVHDYIPNGEPYHMTDLIQKLINAKLNIVAFPIHEYWLDIGAKQEYERAQEEVKKFTLSSL